MTRICRAKGSSASSMDDNEKVGPKLARTKKVRHSGKHQLQRTDPREQISLRGLRATAGKWQGINQG